MQNVVSNLYVVGMGLGVVFVGLIAIIILCYIIGAICTAGKKNRKTEISVEPQPVAPAPAVIENRGEIIAAVSAAVAEELGTEVSAIRILSFKKI